MAPFFVEWGSVKTMPLVLIFTAALLLRVFNLSAHPAGFHFDEANAGYNAYSIIKTGETLKNGAWPIYLNSFGDYRPMGVVYTMIPAVFLLGPTEFAVRFPIALFGALSPVLLFFLVKRLSGESPVSYMAALLLALSPWHINLSRATAEGVLAIFVSLSIFLVYVQIMARPTLRKAILMYLLMGISFITYHPVNLFLVVFMPISLLALWFLKKSGGRDVIKAGAVKLLLLVFMAYVIFPFLTGIFMGGATGRFGQVSISGAVIEHVERELGRVVPQQNDFLVRLFHNKIVDGTLLVGRQYAEYFSPKFLLFEGGPPARYQLPNAGLINIIEFLGLVFLAVNLWSSRRSRPVVFFVFWLLAAPLAAAITTEDQPNVHRTILMIPAISVLAAFGLVGLFRAVPKKLGYKVVLAIAIAGALHYLYFFGQYFVHQKYYEGLNRNYASRDVARELAKIDKDRKILATTYMLATDMYVLFFERIDPKIAQEAYAKSADDRISFLNYTFTNKSECASELDLHGVHVYDGYVDHYFCSLPADWKEILLSDPDGRGSVRIAKRAEFDNLGPTR